MYEEDIKRCQELIDLINERQKQNVPRVERVLNDYKLQLTQRRMKTLQDMQKEETIGRDRDE